MIANQKSLLENLKTPSSGLTPFLDPIRDLLWKKDVNSNSWFVIGHFDAEGHKLNFMYHLMIYPLPTGAVMNACFSVTNETTGAYYGEDHFYPFNEVGISEDTFHIKVPNGFLEGDLDTMKLKAHMEHASLDVTMHSVGNVLYNGGAGMFPVLGITVHQYSIPELVTKGTITIDGKTYEVNGISWFDRQWQQAATTMSASAGKFRWTWMDLNLDCGEYISLWSVVNLETNAENAWATILHKDGSQTVAAMEPLTRNQSEYWKSPVSNQNYPTRWLVNIPEMDTRLEVTASPKEQEIASAHIPKYEAASTVKGTYKGNETAGYCYVELVGAFK